jgi:hypothetical protein
MLSLAVLLGACGSSSDSATSVDVATTVTGAAATASADPAGTGPTSGGIDAEARKAFTDCLKEQGVELPEGLDANNPLGGGIPEGVDIAALQPAMAACRDKLPAGLPAGGAGRPDMAAYTTCLQDNGVTLPDASNIASFDRSDPAFVDANKVCSPLLPEGFTGFGASTTVAG